jgi:hypothetical protein
MSVLLTVLDTYLRVAAREREGGRSTTERMRERAGCRKEYCCQACEEVMPVDVLRTKVFFAGTDHPLVFRLCPACVEFGGVTVG